MKILRKNYIEEHSIPVTESGCWLWTGRYDKDGYGMFRDSKQNNYKNIKAHRYSYKYFFGEIPKGMSALHKCDVTCCVNPKHLFLGTQKDNMQDMTQKNRRVRGEKVGNSKITESDVHQILADLGLGLTQYQVADKYNLTQSHISAIKKGKRWAHVVAPTLNMEDSHPSRG